VNVSDDHQLVSTWCWINIKVMSYKLNNYSLFSLNYVISENVGLHAGLYFVLLFYFYSIQSRRFKLLRQRWKFSSFCILCIFYIVVSSDISAVSTHEFSLYLLVYYVYCIAIIWWIKDLIYNLISIRGSSNYLSWSN